MPCLLRRHAHGAHRPGSCCSQSSRAGCPDGGTRAGVHHPAPLTPRQAPLPALCVLRAGKQMTDSRAPVRASSSPRPPASLGEAPYLGAGRGGPVGPGADWAGETRLPLPPPPRRVSELRGRQSPAAAALVPWLLREASCSRGKLFRTHSGWRATASSSSPSLSCLLFPSPSFSLLRLLLPSAPAAAAGQVSPGRDPAWDTLPARMGKGTPDSASRAAQTPRTPRTRHLRWAVPNARRGPAWGQTGLREGGGGV